MTNQSGPAASFLLRYYKTYPASDYPGLIDESVSVSPERTALIVLHARNIDTEGGIPSPEAFPVFMGSAELNRVAADITQTVVSEAVAIARSAGMKIVHIQGEGVAGRYPENWHKAPGDQPFAPRPDAIPGYMRESAAKRFGKDFRLWEGWRQLDIPECISPQPGDTVVCTSSALDHFCRNHEIQTLFYTGFATDVCLIHAQGGMGDMFDYAYRCILIREGTIGKEYPGTMDDMTVTRLAIRDIERTIGYSMAFSDFKKALSE